MGKVQSIHKYEDTRGRLPHSVTTENPFHSTPLYFLQALALCRVIQITLESNSDHPLLRGFTYISVDSVGRCALADLGNHSTLS